MAVLYTPHFVQFEDENGNPLANGKLYSYAAGTTTPKATFTTAEATVEHSNPIILDAAGRAVLFIEGAYRFDLFDAENNLIKSVDNILSFTTMADSADAFFQSFSGDGLTTAFVLSDDLGTDEKALMVFVDDGLNEYATNGNFATDTDWTKGSGWVIGSGVATATTASTALSQNSEITLIEGQSYNLTYTITRSAGTIIPSIGGTDGESRNSSGTYTETIITGSTQEISFTGSGFTGTLDDVSITKIQSSGANILSPNQYTLDGVNLTFVAAPPIGTNNILVFAPSKLVGAASAAASAAQAAEALAVAAKNDAESAAGLLVITSTTSVLIGTGSKTFTIGADLALNAGQFVLITSDTDAANYMWGTITSYSSTTLIINVEAVGGSGTLNDWTIRLTGARGAQGATGSVTATDSVIAATSAGASLESNNNTECLSWGAGGAANLTAHGNMSMGGTNKIMDMADPSLAQDAATKAYVDDLSLTDYLGGNFNGTTTYLDSLNGSTLTDTKVVTVAAGFRFENAAGVIEYIGSNNGGSWRLYRATDGDLVFFGENAAGAGIMSVGTTTVPCASAGTYHIAFCADLASPSSSKLIINGVAVAVTEFTFTDDDINWSETDYAVGALATGGSRLDGDLYYYYLNTDEYFDVVANAEKFMTGSGVPKSFGYDGSGVTGSQPAIFIGYASGEGLAINRGYLGGSFTVNGTLAAATEQVFGEKHDSPSVSGEIDFAANVTDLLSAATSKPHGLGSAPDDVLVYMVCISTDAGYAVGDKIISSASNQAQSVVTYGYNVLCDDTNVTIVHGEDSQNVYNKSTAALVTTDAAKWKLSFKAIKYQ